MKITPELVREYIKNAADICSETIVGFNMPIIDEITISRAESYWAQIRRVGRDRYSIRVSYVFDLIPDDMLARVRLTSSMAHELIHTQPGCMNHGKNFQKLANNVNKKYPYLEIGTSTISEDFGVVLPPKPYKYHVICKKCGEVSKYYRKPDIWNWIDRNFTPYRCTKCGNDTFCGKQVGT